MYVLDLELASLRVLVLDALCMHVALHHNPVHMHLTCFAQLLHAILVVHFSNQCQGFCTLVPFIFYCISTVHHSNNFLVIVLPYSVVPITDCQNVLECSPSLIPWIKSLTLSKQDEHILTTGGWLSSNHIWAVHLAFSAQEGLNDTIILAEKLIWPSKPQDFVQIIHIII